MKVRALVLAVALVLPAAAASAAPPGSVQQGLKLYGRFCASCHGPGGSGQTR